MIESGWIGKAAARALRMVTVPIYRPVASATGTPGTELLVSRSSTAENGASALMAETLRSMMPLRSRARLADADRVTTLSAVVT
jgi:hypothetical protein